MSNKPSEAKEKKLLFALSDNKKIAILGISDAAYHHMRHERKTLTLDLTSLGIPIGLVLFAAKDHAALRAELLIDENTLDISGIDMGFGSQE